VKQEFEKQDELKRSAMRAVAALLQIPDAGLIFTFTLFYFICLFILIYFLPFMHHCRVDQITHSSYLISLLLLIANLTELLKFCSLLDDK